MLGIQKGDPNFPALPKKTLFFQWKGRLAGSMWELPKIRGTLFWGPYNRDPTI